MMPQFIISTAVRLSVSSVTVRAVMCRWTQMQDRRQNLNSTVLFEGGSGITVNKTKYEQNLYHG